MKETSIRKKVDKKKKESHQTKDQNPLEIKQHSEFQDLCSTCAGIQTCVSRNPGYPVYYCEDHEIFDRVTPKSVQTAETTASQGLCVNCGNKGSCSHSSTEGGVWHCEEYC